jgi:hypothetical protein
MKKIVRVFILASSAFAWFGFAEAVNISDVIINEIAWMGSKTSHADEWIELRNNTGSPINLAGWTLRAADGSPSVKLTERDIIKDFYLLKRGKNYTGALENGGEVLELYDNAGNLVDKVDASSGWPAGDNATKQTMQRTSSGPPEGRGSLEGGWRTGQAREEAPMVAKSPQIQAAVSKEPLESGSLRTSLIAAALAIFSGGAILFLKKKLV